MVALDNRWLHHREWFDYNDEKHTWVPKEGIPDDILESYKRYYEQLDYYRELEKKKGPLCHII